MVLCLHMCFFEGEFMRCVLLRTIKATGAVLILRPTSLFDA